MMRLESNRKNARVEPSDSTIRLGRTRAAALRVLNLCPLLPADAFRHLVHLRSAGGAYRLLRNLKEAGLADVQRVDVGYLLAGRPLGLWSLTEPGRRACDRARVIQIGQRFGTRDNTWFVLKARSRTVRQTNLTLLVAAYRLLAVVVAEHSIEDQKTELRAWEQPWSRRFWCSVQDRELGVRLPAGAVLESAVRTTDEGIVGGERISILLVPDLGTAPVARHREMLRRLHAFCDTRTDGEPQVVVSTVDPDGHGARAAAWRHLLGNEARKGAHPALRWRVLVWEQIASVLAERPPSRGGSAGDSHQHGLHADGRPARSTSPSPASTREQVLHLVGRHPLLSVPQLARLLRSTTTRIRRIELELVESGWLRRVEFDELPHGQLDLGCDEFTRLGLVELTLAGRRRLATWLGLDSTTATRYHGLLGNGRAQTGRRRRLLRTLAHTLGANDIFVELATAAQRVGRIGSTDELAEWRAAAACERGRCKPDGYGCYVRDGLKYGFFLEYDRGTESRRQYAAKFRAYYRYRDSGQAQRDYDGFPTVLCVTTDPVAEYRIAEEAYRAWAIRNSDPLPVLVTTTQRISASDEGIMGPIWRTPPPADWSDAGNREYWLSESQPARAAGAGSSVRRALPFQNSSAGQSNGAE